jgi:GTP-binding protein
LKVLSADFVTSASADGSGIPHDGLPEVALAGRSNVGKSSLINALTRRKIARTSAAPGKTRLVNIYRVELESAAGPGRFALYLVDLPGYGYARGGADSAAELKAVAETYFRRSMDSRGRRLRPPELQRRRKPPSDERGGHAAGIGKGPAVALLLIDSRHPGLDADVQAARWLDSTGTRTYVVATKIDKLTRSERARNLKTIGDTFGTAALPVSAVSGEGLDELWRTIVRIARDADRAG